MGWTQNIARVVLLVSISAAAAVAGATRPAKPEPPAAEGGGPSSEDGERRAGNEQPPAKKHPVVFWELASNNQDRSVEFFRGVFDWDIKYDERIKFYSVETGGTPGKTDGYIFTLAQAKLPFLTVYILVDDIDAKARLVEEKGGLVVESPRVVIPGGPKICLFNDPSGVTFAMIQPQPGGKK